MSHPRHPHHHAHHAHAHGPQVVGSEVLSWLAFLDLLARGEGGGQPGPPGPPGDPTPAPAPIPVTPPFVVPLPSDVPVPVPVAPAPLPVTPSPVPVPPVPVAPPVSPGALPPMPPWPTPPIPGTLPTFPGSGWCPDSPVTAPVAARAAYWNPQLWDYGTKTQRRAFVQEQFGGQWVTFAAAWHPGANGPKTYMATEAWRLCSAPPVAPPTPTPTPTAAKPGPVGPEPAPGAWQSNAAYIARYQAALSWLAKNGGAPAWDTKGVDGRYGPNTAAAVKAFQAAHGLTQDGQCGNATASAIDAAMGYVPVSPATPATPAPVPSSAPMAKPGPVGPEPAPGAWQSNAAYIARYQAALSWLAKNGGAPTWDTKGVDGRYGPNTAAAVKAFQAAHGLTQDGQCGNATASAIDAAMGYGGAPAPAPSPVAPSPAPVPAAPAAPSALPPPPLVQPYPGPGAWQTNAAYIARYQAALSWLAAALGTPAYDPHGVDGRFGPNTAAAVKALQAAHGLTQDGECGADTARVLDAAVAAMGGHG